MYWVFLRITEADMPKLEALIEHSVRTLQALDYSAQQIDGALGTVIGVDSQLIADQTYFLIEDAGEVIGCGGWSKRRTLFGSDHQTGRENSFLDPATEAAKIRAFFVHPQWTRRGIGSQLLEACETAAFAAGFRRFELGATLTGVPLYTARGYVESEKIEVQLGNGTRWNNTSYSENVEDMLCWISLDPD